MDILPSTLCLKLFQSQVLSKENVELSNGVRIFLHFLHGLLKDRVKCFYRNWPVRNSIIYVVVEFVNCLEMFRMFSGANRIVMGDLSLTIGEIDQTKLSETENFFSLKRRSQIHSLCIIFRLCIWSIFPMLRYGWK